MKFNQLRTSFETAKDWAEALLSYVTPKTEEELKEGRRHGGGKPRIRARMQRESRRRNRRVSKH